TGSAAGFENVVGSRFVFGGYPNIRLEVTKPLVLAMREQSEQFTKSPNFLAWVPTRLGRPVQPETATRLGRKVPLDYFPDVLIQLFLCGSHVFSPVAHNRQASIGANSAVPFVARTILVFGNCSVSGAVTKGPEQPNKGNIAAIRFASLFGVKIQVPLGSFVGSLNSTVGERKQMAV